MAETQTPEPTGWLPEDDEGRVYSDFDEAVEMHLDSFYPEPLPRKVRICGFALKEIDVDSWAAYVSENLIERLDEDFMFEDAGYSVSDKGSAAIEEAARVFVGVVIANYTVTTMDSVTTEEVDTEEWVRENRPDWMAEDNWRGFAREDE